LENLCIPLHIYVKEKLGIKNITSEGVFLLRIKKKKILQIFTHNMSVRKYRPCSISGKSIPSDRALWHSDPKEWLNHEIA
jgi:hypothetical protein